LLELDRARKDRGMSDQERIAAAIAAAPVEVQRLFSGTRVVNMPKVSRTELCAKLYATVVQACFDPGRSYTESEINVRLRQIFDDHVALRRYLVTAGCLERASDGSSYLVAAEQLS
jgi:hypothetical protein